MPVIEKHLEDFVRGLMFPPRLVAAIEYGLLGGGKRLRPLLAWHSARAVGGDGASSLRACTAVELIHAFSLVHDDLPAMDNDDLRRGRPTLHVYDGEAMAILAGDAMLSLGFHALIDHPEAGLALRLCRELAAGTEGMIAGQVYDTLGGLPDDAPEDRRLELIHKNKTGALIRASCRMGAACGGAPDDSPAMAGVTAYAEAVGLMFQVVDDLLDVTQPRERVGKRTNKDATSGKVTYPSVMGIEASWRVVKDLERKALGAIAPLGQAAGGLADLARSMARRDR